MQPTLQASEQFEGRQFSRDCRRTEPERKRRRRGAEVEGGVGEEEDPQERETRGLTQAWACARRAGERRLLARQSGFLSLPPER